MANDQQLFLAAEIAPDECPQSTQEWANLIARSLIPNPDFVNPDVGAKDGIIMGGPEPASDEGPWIPEGETEMWFYDPVFAGYFPGGEAPGTIKAVATASNSPGSRWLLCDGSAVPQVLYPRLFSAVGHYFANPDSNGRTGGQSGVDASGLEASGQFRLPDMRGCVLFGQGTARPWQPDFYNETSPATTLGDRVGDITHQITAANMHDAEGYGPIYEFDSGVTNTAQPRIYGGIHYRPLTADNPGTDVDPPVTDANKRFFLWQPSSAIPFYIRY